jgi:hypothetical protein
MKNVRLRVGLVGALAAAAAVLAGTAAPAQAGLLDPVLAPILHIVVPDCGPSSQPFQGFGDGHSYYAIPNNGLEDGSAGWSLFGGAAVTAGNEPFGVNGAGSSSLSLPSGSSALSPAACINLLSPYLRMFAQDSGSDRGLSVQVFFYGVAGNLLGLVNYGTLDPGDHRSWQPTDPIRSLFALPLLTQSFRMRLAPSGRGSGWRIDDVFVDPWLSGAG